MPIQMFDTTTIEAVPDEPQAVAGYVGGRWPTYEPLVWRFPHALHLSIAVGSGEDAECLDIEPGDATVADAPQWVRRQHARGITRPVVYCSLSSAAGLIGTLANAGLARSTVRLWIAHYTGVRHVCGGDCGFGFTDAADATQFTDRALGRNLDESMCIDTFFEPKPDPHHYHWYPAAPFVFGSLWLNERATVHEYDRLIPQPKLNKDRIGILRSHIKLLRDRIWTVAHWDDPPSWDLYHRGWRWQKLNDRLHGPVKL